MRRTRPLAGAAFRVRSDSPDPFSVSADGASDVGSRNQSGSTNRARRRRLLVGPLLRYVDERRATIWFETQRPGRVEVLADGEQGSRHHADTWTVHGHHYALVCIDALRPNSRHEYHVRVNGRTSGRPPIPTSRPASSARRTLTRRSGSPSGAVAARRPSITSTWKSWAPTRWSRLPSAWSRRRRTSGRSSCCCSATRSTQTIRPTRSSPVCARRMPRTPSAIPTCATRSRTSRSTRGCTTRRGRRRGPLAAVDRAERHAARRSRPARRLEHVAVVAPVGDGRRRGGRSG